MVQVIFSTAGDGRTYPDFPGEAGGALCAPVVGPVGLVALLEIPLGLSGPEIGTSVRIASYVRKLSQAQAGTERFWTRSFEQDPWATARQILDWRDGLIADGWLGQPVGAARLDDLAAAEAAEPRLPPGLCDRLARVRSHLALGGPLEVRSVGLSQPVADLPGRWRRLLEILSARGVVLEMIQAQPCAAPGGDLRRVQDFLAGGAIEPLQGDGSFVLVEADTALMASEAVAEWVDAAGPQGQDGLVVLAPDGDTALLDHALRARGLPALGLSLRSASRGALQVLPLAFALAWRPLDAKALLDLLNLPRPPIGRYAASRLSRVLLEHPGIGSRAWEAAWQDIEGRLAEQAETDGASPDTVAEKLSRWRSWTEGVGFDRAQGMSRAEARAIAARVLTWALETDRGEGDPLLLALASASTTFAEVVDVIGVDPLPALLIERILGQELARGAANPAHIAQSGTLRAVDAPGAIWGAAEALIWWPFTGPGDRPPPSPWTRAEVEALRVSGVALDAAAADAQRINRDYVDAILRARGQVLLVRPALSGEAETVAHPLAHQLEPLLASNRAAVSVRAEALLEASPVTIARRSIGRREVEVMDTPEPVPAWSLPDAAIARLADREESATSLGGLVECQLRWVVEDILRVRGGRLSKLPGSDQLFGILAHEIAREVLTPGEAPDPDQVGAAAQVLFDQLLPKIAAPLQRPEHARDLAAARVRVPAALVELARLLRDRNLRVVGSEVERARTPASGLRLKGRLDLVVQTADGVPGVIDLKWTRSSKRYEKEVADGAAIQLAVYSAMLGEDAVAPVPAAYYLLNQRMIIAEKGSAFAQEGVEVVRSLDETYEAVEETWLAWRDLAASGQALTIGLEAGRALAPANLPLTGPDDPCHYCDLTRLCAVKLEAL